FFFFFQAEDGIRDKLVTGVQTCALPILFELPDELLPDLAEVGRVRHPALATFVLRVRLRLVREVPTVVWALSMDPGQTLVPCERSEERRVGKECRTRVARGEYKKMIERR